MISRRPDYTPAVQPSRRDRGPSLEPGSEARALRPAGWLPQAELDERRWIAVGERLGQMSRGVQWWLGDWLRYGFARWGERYGEASKITGYDHRTLPHRASVAGEFDLSRRRDKLTWSHHAAVAGLEPSQQERWLDRAESLRLSVADLRLEIRSLRRTEGTRATCEPGPRATPPQLEETVGKDAIAGRSASLRSIVEPGDARTRLVCPRCGELVSPSP
jgi:hypothetical protein